jgi:hypothetical protein
MVGVVNLSSLIPISLVMIAMVVMVIPMIVMMIFMRTPSIVVIVEYDRFSPCRTSSVDGTT